MPKRSDIALVLDCSGSMACSNPDLSPVGLYQRCARTIHQAVQQMTNPGDVYRTDVLYGWNVKTYSPTLSHDVPTQETATERKRQIDGGSTSIWDATRATIDLLRPRDNVEGNCAFLVVVVTDGGDNNSQPQSLPYVQQWVPRLMHGGHWTFAYLALRTGECHGVFPAEAGYGYDLDAFDAALQNVLQRFLQVRDTGAQHMENTFEEVEAATDAE